MTVPIELQVWNAADCAEYLKESREHFLRTTRHGVSFPAPILSSLGKRPRWSAAHVVKWALA